jgi:Zn finger protein HypA/HybF involved in hydrogenase expression
MSKHKKILKDLEKYVNNMGKELGVPAEEDIDLKVHTCDCKCGCQGHDRDVLYKNNNFYCPKCGKEFVTREE